MTTCPRTQISRAASRSFFLLVALLLTPFVGAETFNEYINDQLTETNNTVTLPTGTYEINQSDLINGCGLILSYKDGTVINGNDSTILMKATGRAILLRYSNNVTIKNLTIEYDPLPFTQGIVTWLSTDKKEALVEIDEGYPVPPESSVVLKRTIIHNAGNQNFLESSATRTRTQVIGVEDNEIHIKHPQAYDQLNTVGKRISLAYNYKEDAEAVVSVENTGCVFENITVYSSPAVGFKENRGSANTYDGITITRNPNPPAGATVLPVRSTNADGIHSLGTRIGPEIINSLIEDCGDDAIAIRGMYAQAAETVTDATTVLFYGAPLDFYSPGDRFRIYLDEGHGAQLIRTIDGDVLDVTSTVPPIAGFNTTLQISFTSPVTLEAGDMAVNEYTQGNDFRVENNTIKNIRARGIYVKAGGDIIDNTIIRTQLNGIRMSPENISFLEAGFARDINIVGNRVVRANHGAPNPAMFQAGAICFSHDDWDWGKGGHANISIDDNIIEKTRGPSLQIQFARDVTVTNNIFEDPNMIDGYFGSNEIPAADEKAVVWLDRVNNVYFDNNAVVYDEKVFTPPESEQNPYHVDLVLHRDCSNISGDTTF